MYLGTSTSEKIVQTWRRNQYGSIKKSSTTHALVDNISVIQAQMHRSSMSGYHCLTSLRFDLINHNIPLQKLASFCLPNMLMKWIASFLTKNPTRHSATRHKARPRVTEAKILGITITSNLTWDVCVEEITRKAGKRLFLLLQLKRSDIPAEYLLTVYTTVVRPTLEYACPAWPTSLTLRPQTDMERVQRRAMNIIYPNPPYIEALANAQLSSLKERRAQLCEHVFTQIEQPQHKLHKLLPKPRTTTHNTRCRTRYSLPREKNQQDQELFH